MNLEEALRRLPSPWPEALRPRIQAHLRASGRSVVVLDDDPTGTQTVYDTPVLTDWSEASLTRELAAGTPLFYVLTNSRSLFERDAAELARDAGVNLSAAARASGRAVAVVSRSDSTLRGHYPAEVDALADALGLMEAPRLLIPFFAEGGRYTLDDVHYVAEGNELIPAAETAFARDASFGYRNSNLRQWIAEKTRGQVKAEDVRSISIETIRLGGPAAVKDLLRALPARSVGVVNAAALHDLEVVAAALLEIETEGKQFLCRSAASFVQARAGLETRPLLYGNAGGRPSPGWAGSVGTGGLVVVGSHVRKTTAQLECLIQAAGLAAVELVVTELLASDERASAALRVATAQLNALLAKGSSVALFTSRDLVSGRASEESLAIGKLVSSALASVVSGLTVTPQFLVAKGGITASDLATASLGVRRALVRGQIIPGVPVWKLGSESRFPGMDYVVFPGNVGGPEALLEVYRKLSGPERCGRLDS